MIATTVQLIIQNQEISTFVHLLRSFVRSIANRRQQKLKNSLKIQSVRTAVWPDGDVISQFTTMKMFLISFKFTNLCSIFCQILNKPSKICQRILQISLGVKFHQIWPHWTEEEILSSRHFFRFALLSKCTKCCHLRLTDKRISYLPITSRC